MKRRSEIWSVRIRLISSGIVRSKLRSPASTWATLTPELDGDQGAGNRRIDVADDEHEVGSRIEQHGLEGGHDRRRLLRVAARSHVQVDVGRRHAEVVEEHLRELFVVVLAGVDDDGGEEVRPRLQLRHDGRDLHEVRPRADDAEDREGARH